MTSTTQRNIAIAAIVVTAAAIAWMLTHRRAPREDLYGPVSPPALLELTVQHEGQKRPWKDGDTLTAGDGIDFQIEVEDLCFVYVYSVQADVARLDWGAKADDGAWKKGVYAPDFYAGTSGLRFGAPGEAALYVVASPLPIADAPTWKTESLKDVASKCPKCGVTSAKFRVVARQ